MDMVVWSRQGLDDWALGLAGQLLSSSASPGGRLLDPWRRLLGRPWLLAASWSAARRWLVWQQSGDLPAEERRRAAYESPWGRDRRGCVASQAGPG